MNLLASSTGRPAKRVLSGDSVRSAKPAAGAIGKPFRVPTPKPQPVNGDVVFDAKAFLAKAGFGKRIVNLKKPRLPSRKATLPTRFFTCRRAGCE